MAEVVEVEVEVVLVVEDVEEVFAGVVDVEEEVVVLLVAAAGTTPLYWYKWRKESIFEHTADIRLLPLSPVHTLHSASTTKLSAPFVFDAVG